MEIRPFVPNSASQADFVALAALQNRLRAESWPNDPPVKVEELRRNSRNQPEFVETHRWVVPEADGAGYVAYGNFTCWHTQDNQHAGEFYLMVLPERRRQGIGTRLLSSAVAAAERANRRLLMAWTQSNVPAGGAFMERVGARRGLEETVSELRLDTLDRDRVRDWVERARQWDPEFELVLWDGLFPEAELEAIARMQMAMNAAPRQELEIEDEVITPAILRERERTMKARQIERWVMAVRERNTRELAGYTAVFWNPENPMFLQQGDTAVFPRFRNRGFGRWLKGAMIEKVLRDRPEVTRVRTDNAHTNASMLQINFDMGFKPVKSGHVWQLDVPQARAYLSSRS